MLKNIVFNVALQQAAVAVDSLTPEEASNMDNFTSSSKSCQVSVCRCFCLKTYHYLGSQTWVHFIAGS